MSTMVGIAGKSSEGVAAYRGNRCSRVEANEQRVDQPSTTFTVTRPLTLVEVLASLNHTKPVVDRHSSRRITVYWI